VKAARGDVQYTRRSISLVFIARVFSKPVTPEDVHSMAFAVRRSRDVFTFEEGGVVSGIPACLRRGAG